MIMCHYSVCVFSVYALMFSSTQLVYYFSSSDEFSPFAVLLTHQFPRVTKLATLLVKTLAKPLSKRIKHEFSRYQFTQRILVGIGQTSHQVTSRLTIWSAGYTVRRITPLEDEKAMSTGADFVGESFILLVSGFTVVWEYNRSKEKEREKNEKQREQATQERLTLQAKLHALDVRVKALEQVIEKNSQSILSIGQEKYVPPDSKELVPIDEEEAIIVHKEKSSESQPKPADSKNNQKANKPWWTWRPW